LIDLIIDAFIFFVPMALTSLGLKYWTKKIMSGMVTVRTRKLWTCLPGKPCWLAGWQHTNAGTRKLLLTDQSSHPSSIFRFVPGIPGHWHSYLFFLLILFFLDFLFI